MCGGGGVAAEEKSPNVRCSMNLQGVQGVLRRPWKKSVGGVAAKEKSPDVRCSLGHHMG